MKRIEFRLSMPHVNSWNGKWTGNGRNYIIVQSMSDKVATNLLSGKDKESFYHDFGDGWTACVTARVVPSGERLGKSDGFCGYNWMVDNIRAYGSTRPPKENCGAVAELPPTPQSQNVPMEKTVTQAATSAVA